MADFILQLLDVNSASVVFFVCFISADSGCALSGRGPIHARILQTPEPARL